MKWTVKHKNLNIWHPWFAWHPVQVEPQEANITKWRWLEWVDRRVFCTFYWEYRDPGDDRLPDYPKFT